MRAFLHELLHVVAPEEEALPLHQRHLPVAGPGGPVVLQDPHGHLLVLQRLEVLGQRREGGVSGDTTAQRGSCAGREPRPPGAHEGEIDPDAVGRAAHVCAEELAVAFEKVLLLWGGGGRANVGGRLSPRPPRAGARRGGALRCVSEGKKPRKGERAATLRLSSISLGRAAPTSQRRERILSRRALLRVGAGGVASLSGTAGRRALGTVRQLNSRNPRWALRQSGSSRTSTPSAAACS